MEEIRKVGTFLDRLGEIDIRCAFVKRDEAVLDSLLNE